MEEGRIVRGIIPYWTLGVKAKKDIWTPCFSNDRREGKIPECTIHVDIFTADFVSEGVPP
jgi:hypothetical protein